MTDELDDLEYIAQENAREFGLANPKLDVVAAPSVVEATPAPADPEPVAEAAQAEEPAAEVEPVAATEDTPKADRYEDPDTGEKWDMRYRSSKRIQKLLQERAQLRAELARQQTQPAAPATPDPQTTPRPTSVGATKPQLGDFETVEAWEDAVFDWRTQQAESKRQAEEARTRAQTVQQQDQARMAAARTKYPDYDAVISKPLGFGLPPHVITQIVESEQSADLRYYFAQHPDELFALTTQPATSTLKAIARLEAKLEAPATPKPAAKSAAPTPGQPLKTGTPTAKVDVFDLPDDEYIAVRNAQDRRRRMAGVNL